VCVRVCVCVCACVCVCVGGIDSFAYTEYIYTAYLILQAGGIL